VVYFFKALIKIASKWRVLICLFICLWSSIDGVMRTMNTEKLIKTLPIIQNQLDALLDFQVCDGEHA